MSLKTCFKCLRELLLTEFYKHPAMGDGHLGKCKECTKADARAHRLDRLDYYRAYDRKRGARRTAAQSRAYARANPNKTKAKRAVAYQVWKGALVALPCVKCGRAENVHAHHDDYSKPLDVMWLCPPCHFARHKEMA